MNHHSRDIRQASRHILDVVKCWAWHDHAAIQERIKTRAYFIWQSSGRVDAWANWLEAERIERCVSHREWATP